jgi:hypothetical protein
VSATFCERVALLHGRQGKVGDYVLQLGPDSAAPGARVVYEAKANKRYTIPNALKELAEARKNRAAQVGVRVFDRSSAPKDMEPLCRFGTTCWWRGIPKSRPPIYCSMVARNRAALRADSCAWPLLR